MKNLLFFTLILLIGCKRGPKEQEGTLPPLREYSVQTVLWQQNAAEYKALCHQAYNIARLQLEKALSNQADTTKPLAIIADIDETVLDNSPFNAKMIELDKDYSKERWAEWVKRKAAKPVPGAVGFFQFAEAKGIEIFYISNRYVSEKTATLANLEQLGFPMASGEHVLLKDSTSRKQARRNVVLKNYRVIMYLGDNLSDFSKVFDGKERSSYADSLKAKFGFEFIVFPNPMYGDWETKGIYEGRYDWAPAEKDSIRKVKLESY